MAVVTSEATTATTRQPGAVTVMGRARGWMSGFLARRILRALLTVLLVTTLIFFLVRLLPGSPVEVFVNRQVTQFGYSPEEARNQARSLFAIDIDKPVGLQYLDYLGSLARGNLGMSVAAPGTSVGEVIAQRLPWTLFSVGAALLVAFTLGSALGLLMAYRRGTRTDVVLSVVASLSGSVPNFLGALLLITVFGTRLHWVPFTDMRGSHSPGQAIEPSLAFVRDALYHAALPVLVYVLFSIGGWMLLMKGSAVAVLEEDFVAAARARGVPEWRLAIFHVGRNAVLPLFTHLAVAIGFVTGGSLLIEPIFAYDGIGSELWRAIQARDYSMMQGIFLIVTVSVVVANLGADLLYSRLDPRIRSEERGDAWLAS